MHIVMIENTFPNKHRPKGEMGSCFEQLHQNTNIKYRNQDLSSVQKPVIPFYWIPIMDDHLQYLLDVGRKTAKPCKTPKLHPNCNY